LVQQELHPSDEGRKGHGDPGQPRADETAPGVSEALTAEPVGAVEPLLPGFEAPEHPEFTAPEHPEFSAAPDAAAPDMRLAIDDRAGVFMHRLNVWKDEVVAWFKTLASAAVYATLIVTFGFQVARVEGQSMAPTLSDQDRLIVNKLAYRMGEPRRGDIVMLYYPLNPDKSFVKRVIAEEGDQVRIVDGRVFVNDVPMQDDFVPPEYRSHDDFGPSVIPEGYYFVMGDHRNNSSDSRHWGFVPKKYIIGRVQLRWWPIPTAHVF
jgi:signal peptidase I